MTARAYHARTSKGYWVNHHRHYEFDTFNSDHDGNLSLSSYKRAAMRFDKQFSQPAKELECYIVTRKNRKYIVSLEVK